MLRYKTKTRPGLVALYDIRPGNGAGPFLQPRSPHGAWEGAYRGGRPPTAYYQHLDTLPLNYSKLIMALCHNVQDT